MNPGFGGKVHHLKGLSKGFLKRIFNKKKDGTKPRRIQDLEEKIIFERFLKRIFKKDFQQEKTGPSQESRIWRNSSSLKGF